METIQRWKLKNRRVTKLPIQSPLISKLRAQWIGYIVTIWGQFENQMDDLIAILLKANSNSEIGWERLNFKKRRALMKRELLQALPQCPFLINYVNRIMADATYFHICRNMIVHGRMLLYLTPTDQVQMIRIRHSGKLIEGYFRAEEYETLFKEIAHLLAVFTFICEVKSVDQVPIPSHERYALRQMLANNHPSPAIPSLPIRPR